MAVTTPCRNMQYLSQLKMSTWGPQMLIGFVWAYHPSSWVQIPSPSYALFDLFSNCIINLSSHCEKNDNELKGFRVGQFLKNVLLHWLSPSACFLFGQIQVATFSQITLYSLYLSILVPQWSIWATNAPCFTGMASIPYHATIIWVLRHFSFLPKVNIGTGSRLNSLLRKRPLSPLPSCLGPYYWQTSLCFNKTTRLDRFAIKKTFCTNT